MPPSCVPRSRGPDPSLACHLTAPRRRHARGRGESPSDPVRSPGAASRASSPRRAILPEQRGMTMAATGGPLAGVRVIDLTIWVQGPIGGTLLADLGADVIKVEKADGGDFSRGLTALFGVDLRRPDAPNLLWALCNRNKRAITLDLHHEAARAVFHRLLHGADVFLTNLHPSSLTAFAA